MIYLELFKGFYTSIFNGARVEHAQIDIPWEVIEERRKLFGKLYECFSYACIIRDYLESDTETGPSTICFKAVEPRNHLWHIWVELNGKIIDTEKFKREYRNVYSLGKHTIKYEQLYQKYREDGEFNWSESLY